MEGHSDADAVIHALCDAVLGALCLGDIGKHFPDTDPKFKNVDSRILLKQVVDLIKQKKYRLGNADITILAQAPKMAGHIPAMRETLASDLNCSIEDINVKATTSEGMGFVGRGEGISVHSVILLVPA